MLILNYAASTQIGLLQPSHNPQFDLIPKSSLFDLTSSSSTKITVLNIQPDLPGVTPIVRPLLHSSESLESLAGSMLENVIIQAIKGEHDGNKRRNIIFIEKDNNSI